MTASSCQDTRIQGSPFNTALQNYFVKWSSNKLFEIISRELELDIRYNLMFAQIVSNAFHSLSINPIPGTSTTNTIQEWYKLIKSQVFIPSKQDILHFDQVTWLYEYVVTF